MLKVSELVLNSKVVLFFCFFEYENVFLIFFRIRYIEVISYFFKVFDFRQVIFMFVLNKLLGLIIVYGSEIIK